MTKNKPPAVEERVRDFLKRHNPGGQLLLVAVSGGADSVCLLHVLINLREELKLNLHVAHLDHGLRGVEAKADAAYVSRLASRLGVPVTIEKRDVTAYRQAHRLSTEEAAREVRYRFLAEMAASTGSNMVAVGHTLNDQVETVLMHLVRGSGTRGLVGLRPVGPWPMPDGEGLTVVRPLLDVSRRETEAYCRRHRLAARTDTSNLSLSPLRNRIRLELLPLLREYNPRVAEAVLRTAAIVADDLAFIDGETERLWKKVAAKRQNTVVLDRDAFGWLPPAIKRSLLRLSIKRLIGGLKDIEARHIEAVMEALDKPAGKQLNLPDGLIFATEYDRYLLTTEPAALSPFPVLEGEYRLNIPGETWLPGWLVSATFVKPPPQAEENKLVAYVDLEKTGRLLLLRPRRRGDRFIPAGLGHEKKLGVFMIDARIPQAWRDRIPVVCSPQQIVWLAGYRLDERAGITPETKKVLRLEFSLTAPA
ncbi:MAG: tRNA lysidine(34) synthetase TilS [Dehalococcoidales bacterium]